METPLYPVSFNGYHGTVEVSEGTLNIDLPKTIGSGALGSATFPIKRYFLSLLTPNRENIEFELYRFLDGAWFEWLMLTMAFARPLITPEIKEAAKKEIERLGI